MSCWQVLSEVELRRIFDVYKRCVNSGFACICNEKYGPIYEAIRPIRSLLVWKSSTYPWPRPRVPAAFSHLQCAKRRFGLLYRNILVFVWNRSYGIIKCFLFFLIFLINSLWKIILKSILQLMYIIICILCSILLYIRNLKNYFFRILFSMIISWLLLF